MAEYTQEQMTFLRRAQVAVPDSEGNYEYISGQLRNGFTPPDGPFAIKALVAANVFDLNRDPSVVGLLLSNEGFRESISKHFKDSLKADKNFSIRETLGENIFYKCIDCKVPGAVEEQRDAVLNAKNVTNAYRTRPTY